MTTGRRQKLVQANVRVEAGIHRRLISALRRARRARTWSPLVRAFEAYVLAVLEGRLEIPAPTDQATLQRFRRVATGLEEPREDDRLYAAISEVAAAARARRPQTAADPREVRPLGIGPARPRPPAPWSGPQRPRRRDSER